MNNNQNNNNSTNILNKLYSADVVDKSFKDPETGDIRKYSTLDLTIKLGNKKRTVSLSLPAKTNLADLLIASSDKPSNFLQDDELM